MGILKRRQKATKRSVFIIACSIFFLILLTLVAPYLLSVVWTMLVGWAYVLWDVVLGSLQCWKQILLGILWLSFLGYGMHRCARWLQCAHQSMSHWKRQWTVCLMAIVVALCGGAMAYSGLKHYLVWMSDKPIFEKNQRVYRTKSIAHLTQVFVALTEYESSFKRLPSGLVNLKERYPTLPDVLLYDQTEEGWQPWIYLGNEYQQAEKMGESLNIPVIISPYQYAKAEKKGAHIVLLLDGTIETYCVVELEELFPDLTSLLPYLFRK